MRRVQTVPIKDVVAVVTEWEGNGWECVGHDVDPDGRRFLTFEKPDALPDDHAGEGKSPAVQMLTEHHNLLAPHWRHGSESSSHCLARLLSELQEWREGKQRFLGRHGTITVRETGTYYVHWGREGVRLVRVEPESHKERARVLLREVGLNPSVEAIPWEESRRAKHDYPSRCASIADALTLLDYKPDRDGKRWVRRPTAEDVQAAFEEIGSLDQTPAPTSLVKREVVGEWTGGSACPECNGEPTVGQLNMRTTCPKCGEWGK